MIIPKLAVRNLWGAGIRTWLNVFVLSFAYVIIIATQGLFEGLNEQLKTSSIKSQFGGGQYWQKNYNPNDMLTLTDAHAIIPASLKKLINKQEAVPILITQATIYPEGRIFPVLLKGIDPPQKTLELPSRFLQGESNAIPGLIGTRLAKAVNLHEGDYITARWRDNDGTFDAAEIKIVKIMNSLDPAVDNGQIWIPLSKLQTMTAMENEATIIVLSTPLLNPISNPEWSFKDTDFLLKDITEIIKTKQTSSIIMYIMLLFLAMLAIFDTQVLAIFKRRKEIGTLIALGMTRNKVMQLFTFEGSLHGFLAMIMAAFYGTPLLYLFAVKGLGIPESADSYGFALGQTLYPIYDMKLIIATSLIILITVTAVSFIPVRRIAHMKPTDALRGKML